MSDILVRSAFQEIMTFKFQLFYGNGRRRLTIKLQILMKIDKKFSSFRLAF